MSPRRLRPSSVVALARRLAMLGLALGLGAGVAGCASTPPLKLSATPDRPVDLDGTWQVDPSRSEDAAAKIKLVILEQVGGRAGRRPGAGRLGAGAGIQDKIAQAKAKAADMAEAIAERLPMPDRLDIAEHPNAIDIAMDGHRRTLPYGRTLQTPQGSVRTGWDGDAFVVDIQRGDDVSLRQRYTLSPSDHSLTLTTLVTTQKLSRPVSILRVFVPKRDAGKQPGASEHPL